MLAAHLTELETRLAQDLLRGLVADIAAQIDDDVAELALEGAAPARLHDPAGVEVVVQEIHAGQGRGRDVGLANHAGAIAVGVVGDSRSIAVVSPST